MSYTYRIIQWVDSSIQVQRIEDGAYIPNDTSNCDYMTYLRWVAAGNTATIVAYVEPPASSPLSSQAYVDTAVAAKLDVSAVASVAQMEAATANNAYVSPLAVNRSPACAKVWVNFNGSGTINASYNIASVVKNGTGLWTITYTVPFSSANYAPILTAEYSAVATLVQLGVKTGTAAAGSIQIQLFNALGALLDPAGKIYFHAFGDQ